MRISNVEWLKKRIGFIRKLGEQTTRQILEMLGVTRLSDLLSDALLKAAIQKRK